MRILLAVCCSTATRPTFHSFLPSFSSWNVLFSALCDSAVTFDLNSDGPDKAQQLSTNRGYDFLFFLAGCD